MKTQLLTRTSIELAERLIDRCFYGEEPLESVDRFLSESIDLALDVGVDLYGRQLEYSVAGTRILATDRVAVYLAAGLSFEVLR